MLIIEILFSSVPCCTRRLRLWSSYLKIKLLKLSQPTEGATYDKMWKKKSVAKASISHVYHKFVNFFIVHFILCTGLYVCVCVCVCVCRYVCVCRCGCMHVCMYCSLWLPYLRIYRTFIINSQTDY